jgi:hypothetical protein
MLDFMQDPKHVGGLPGIILSLHTWTQVLLLHPHIHCLVTGGGLWGDGTWRLPKRDTLLPYKAVMNKFRGKLLDYIDKAIKKGKIKLPVDMNRQQWTNLKNKLGRKTKWNVKICERYRHGQGVATYLARYLRGGPIANSRIVSLVDGMVRFRYRINGNKHKKFDYTSLPIGEFIQRYLLHVPVPNSKNVRNYGLYSPNKKVELEKCREMFGQLPIDETEFLTWQKFCEEQGDKHPELCPKCGKKLIRLDVIPPKRNSNRIETRLKRKAELKFPSVGGPAIFCGGQL